MCSKLRTLFVKYRDVVAYLFFGGLTTLVNYLVYYLLFNIFFFSAAGSNVIAWLFAVVFAFFTNKPFVFGSKDWSREVVVPEVLKFLGCRLSSGLIETLLLFVLVDQFDFNGNIWKLLISVLVVLLNYVFSKFIVFEK